MRIDSDTNIDGTPTPAGTFSVVGVLGQFDTSSPFDSGYQLFPRALADITVSGASAITATPSAYDFGSVTRRRHRLQDVHDHQRQRIERHADDAVHPGRRERGSVFGRRAGGHEPGGWRVDQRRA